MRKEITICHKGSKINCKIRHLRPHKVHLLPVIITHAHNSTPSYFLSRLPPHALKASPSPTNPTHIMTDRRSIQGSPSKRVNLDLAFLIFIEIHMVDCETAIAPRNHDIAVGRAVEEFAGGGGMATAEVHLGAIVTVGFE